MAFENIKAEIIDLFEKMINQPHDAHELGIELRERLNELKASGMPLPDDLAELEARLDAEFAKRQAKSGIDRPPRK